MAQNSHFHPEFIASPVDRSEFESWAWTYFLLKNKGNINNILSGFGAFYASHVGKISEDAKTEPYVQRITDIHLHSNKYREIEENSNMTVIHTLFIAALILWMIALTNYLSLNLGMAGFSDKYLFVSKVSGSSRWMKQKYFLIESGIIFILAILFSGFIAAVFNLRIQERYALDLFEGNIIWTLLAVLLFCLSGIVLGVFPMISQTKNRMHSVLNWKFNAVNNRRPVNRGLMMFQYAVTMMLIVAVIIIYRQTHYALESSMGAGSANNLICFENQPVYVQEKFEVFKKELLKCGSVESVSAMFEPPAGEANDKFQFELEGYVNELHEAKNDRIGVFPCDYSFADVFKLTFLSGCNFSETNIDHNGSGEFIINESAMRRLNYTDPDQIIGKKFRLIQNYASEIPSGTIIGVVKDFHLSNVKRKTEPLVLFKKDALWLINLVVSFKPEMKAQALSDIENTWKHLFPDYSFQYSYVDSMYKNIYKTELLQIRLLSVFAGMSLFICSIGLLGLSLLITQRRTKEIGIRKVNGANITETMMMLNFDFIKWIILSLLLAIPLACFLCINGWRIMLTRSI